MCEYLNVVDVSVLNDAVQQKISEQCLLGKSFVDAKYSNHGVIVLSLVIVGTSKLKLKVSRQNLHLPTAWLLMQLDLTGGKTCQSSPT